MRHQCLSPPTVVQGVYGTLPMGSKSPKSPDICHIDSYLDSRQRLSCVAYIDDVAPHGGAFMVRPYLSLALTPRSPSAARSASAP